MTPLHLGACIDRFVEAPLVHASDLPGARSLTPDGAGHLLVGGVSGLWRIDAAGVVLLQSKEPVVAVTAHPGRVYTLGVDLLSWEGGAMATPGAVDAVAAWNGEVWVAGSAGLVRVDPVALTSVPVAGGPSGLRSLALGPDRTVLALGASQLQAFGVDGTEQWVVAGLSDARAAATDETGRVWIAQRGGLWRVEGPDLVLGSSFVEHVADLHFGPGARFPSRHLYIANPDGTLDWLRPGP